MPEKFKALIFLLALAVPAFYVAGRIAGSVITRREFAVLRNVWFAVTIAAFLSGSYLVFAAIMAMICLYLRAVGVASVGLYFVMLLAAPPAMVSIGGFAGINRLIDLNGVLVLSAFLLLPLLLKTRGHRGGVSNANALPDRLIICYVVLTTVLDFRQAEVTGIMRVAVTQTFEVLIPYFAISRAITTSAELHKVSLAFVVAVLPLALVGILETSKHWLLYSPILQDWVGPETLYSSRGGLLRASASANDPIAFGLMVMVAIGCLMIPPLNMHKMFTRIALAILAAGLVASLSRGPWVGVGILVLAYFATGPGAAAQIGRLAVFGAVMVVILSLTPVGTQLIDMLPFVGSADSGSVDYRQHLLQSATEVVKRSPWFGLADYLDEPEMQELMQGQHIIDVVNTYVQIALSYGLVGLGLFVGFFGTILVGLRRVLKAGIAKEIGLAGGTRAAMATLIAILVTIGTVSSISFIPAIYWSFAGLCVAFVRVSYKERAAARSRNRGDLVIHQGVLERVS